MAIPRVQATATARQLIRSLQEQHGKLIFHQSGGCCDGSQPMCFEQGDFRIGSSDVCLGNIEGCPFWMSKDQFAYWQHTQLTIDVAAGRGASFSLEIPRGLRFITKSRIFTDEEAENLEPLRYAED